MKCCTHFSLFPNTLGNISACVSKVSLLSNSLYDSEGFKVTVCYQKSTMTYINVSYHCISHLQCLFRARPSYIKLPFTRLSCQSVIKARRQLAQNHGFFKNHYKYMLIFSKNDITLTRRIFVSIF